MGVTASPTKILLTITEQWPDRTAPVGTFAIESDVLPYVGGVDVSNVRLIGVANGVTTSYAGEVPQGWEVKRLTALGWTYHSDPDYVVGQEPIPPMIIGRARVGMSELG